MSRAKLGVGLLVIAAIIGIAGGCKKEEKAGAGAAGMPPPLVVAGEARAVDVPVYIDGIGKATAIESVVITPRVPGQIIEKRFEDGAQVKRGQVLFVIDPRPFQATLAQAKAQLAQSKASLDLANIEYKRYLALSSTPAISQSDLDIKKNAVEVSEAQIQASEAAIQTAQVNLDYCTIASPIDGRAGARMVDVGNVVKENDTSLLSVQRIDPVYADFTVNEQQLAAVRENMAQGTLKTLVSLPTDGAMGKPGVGHEGSLTFLDNAVQSGSGTVKLRATVPNGDAHFWPGQFVNVRLVLKVQRDAVVVPSSVPQMSQAGEFVYVIKEGVPPHAPGTPAGAPGMYAEMRPVVTGQKQGDDVVVVSGLAAGEKVVVDGQMMVRPNGPVRMAPVGGAGGGAAGNGAPAGGGAKPAATTAPSSPATAPAGTLPRADAGNDIDGGAK